MLLKVASQSINKMTKQNKYIKYRITMVRKILKLQEMTSVPKWPLLLVITLITNRKMKIVAIMFSSRQILKEWAIKSAYYRSIDTILNIIIII